MRSKILVDSAMKRLFTLPGLGKSLAKYAKMPTTPKMPANKNPKKIRNVHFQNPDFFFGVDEEEFIGTFTVPSGPLEKTGAEGVGGFSLEKIFTTNCPADEFASRDGNEFGSSRRRRHAARASRRTVLTCSMLATQGLYRKYPKNAFFVLKFFLQHETFGSFWCGCWVRGIYFRLFIGKLRVKSCPYCSAEKGRVQGIKVKRVFFEIRREECGTFFPCLVFLPG